MTAKTKLKDIVGILWAFPVTFLMLLYVLPLWALKKYKFDGTFKTALVWSYDIKKVTQLDVFLEKAWKNWAGHAAGNVIVIKNTFDVKTRMMTMVHEYEHVRQSMVLGAFFPIVYLFILFIMKLVMKQSHPYYSHPFEIEARRVAGQIVDIETAQKKLQKLFKKSRALR